MANPARHSKTTTGRRALEDRTPQAGVDFRQTLLKMMMTDALTEVFGMAGGRQRMTANLHPMATRVLFLSTEGRFQFRSATPGSMSEDEGLRKLAKIFANTSGGACQLCVARGTVFRLSAMPSSSPCSCTSQSHESWASFPLGWGACV